MNEFNTANTNETTAVSDVTASFSDTNPVTPIQPTFPKKDEADATVGFGTFFGSEFLLSIPVIGFIAAIVMSFAPKRKNLKNYVRAKLTWMIAKVALSVVSVIILVSLLSTLILGAINTELGTNFTDINQVVGTIEGIQNGDYTAAIPLFKNIVPPEYAPLIDELATGNYDDIVDLFAEGDFQGVIDALDSGNYEDLKNSVDAETYEEILNELEMAAAGERLPWMDVTDNLGSDDLNGILDGIINGDTNIAY